MFRKFSDWLNKVSVWWVAVLFLVIFFVFTATEVVSQSEKSAQYQGDAGSVDLSFWYTADDIFNMAEVYGKDGRAEYIHARTTFDLIFPMIYGIFLITSISYMAEKQFEPGSKWLFLNYVPMLGMVFDYIENSFAIIVMNSFPDRLETLAGFTPIMTMMKWIFVGGSFVVLFILLVRLIALKFMKRR